MIDTFLQKYRASKWVEMEAALARSLAGFVSEMRMTDAKCLIELIRDGLAGHISDLVTSSAELHFKKGALSYGLLSDYYLTWSRAPVVEMHMEFQYGGIFAFFVVTLEQRHASVTLIRVLDQGDPFGSTVEPGSLIHALTSAAVEH